MRKYIGSYMTGYAAIVGTVFFTAPIFISFFVLRLEVTAETIAISIFCMVSSVILGICLYRVSDQLFAMARFDENCIVIEPLFKRAYKIEYAKCKCVGIGWYIHRGFHFKWGYKVCYLFLSYDMIDETYRHQMNYWLPSETGVKIEFNEVVYQYLVSVLPQKQANALQRDYRNMKL